MKKEMIIYLMAVSSLLGFGFTPPSGNNTVMVNQSDVLVAPTATELINANPELSDYFQVNGWQVNIDTTPSVNAFDATETQSADVFIVKNADLNMGASTSGGWENVSATKGCWQAKKGGYSCYYINNYDLTGDTQAASLGINYAVALSTTALSGVPITQQLYNNKIDLSPYAGRTVKISYSFYAKKIFDGSATLALATLGTVSTNLTQIKRWNPELVFNSWVKLEDTIYYTVPARTDGEVQRIGFVAAGIVDNVIINVDNGAVALANFNFQVLEEAEYSVPKNTEWTDGEFKVLDASGNLIYWVSTQWGAQMGGEYESNPATDLNAKIFYTSPENENNGAGKGREWIEYVHNSSNARTIYEHAQTITGSATPTISGIIIQPNFTGTTVGGTSIQSIFGKNAKNAPQGNQYIYLKCSPLSIEKTSSGLAVWRTATITPIQKGN